MDAALEIDFINFPIMKLTLQINQAKQIIIQSIITNKKEFF